ncbi:glycosyltransferase family 4 protein [Luteibacter yeojuensis]|uniref:Glycosyl transferase n=1 Tax=Luteibacter yeojuensis TaxID=345309 RepID=A0A0F3L386_9GAMM|nr:glycosyltransferase family 4 protein [Luteibacter yeojuensis]KJV36809.1 glycosyl transferase [Luteibacter yeojuensis]
MRVVQLNLHPAPAGMPPAELFLHWTSLADIPEAVAAGGPRVTVLQAADHDTRFTRHGIDYVFVDLRDATSPRARGRRVADLLRTRMPDVLHIHSLACAEEAAAIAHALPALPILLQDHADRVPNWWRRPAWRRWMRSVDAVAFTAPLLAQRFQAAGLFPPALRVFAIPESSCRFTPGQRDAARAASGVDGAPAVAWVGHLNENKDPLAVLDGFARLAAEVPGARLHCVYGRAPLLDAVRARIDGDTRLTGRVRLIGSVPHGEVETLMRAADIYVSGSHAESCGFALLEAMACGTVPVVTDIPSFRELTGNGAVGRLYPAGDGARCGDALLAVARSQPPRELVREYFQQYLSFPAMGRRWAAAYAQLADARRRRA